LIDLVSIDNDLFVKALRWKKFRILPKFKILLRLSCLAKHFFQLFFDGYILVSHNNCFKNAADMPLFCGEDLNFGAFSKFFPPGQLPDIIDCIDCTHVCIIITPLATSQWI
jgi:hypothetical protein